MTDTKIEDIVDDKEKAEKLSQIIEEKVEQKVKQIAKSEKKEDKQENENLSRRSFLKKLGAGAIGLGAASLIPNASAYNIRSSDGLEVYDSNQKNLDVQNNGNVKIPNGSMVLGGDLYPEYGTGPFAIWTAGEGSDVIKLKDQANNQDILRANEGGNVEIPNGNLSLTSEGGESTFYIAGTGSNTSSGGRIDFSEAKGGSTTFRYQHDGNANTLRLQSPFEGIDPIIQYYRNGNVEVPNGDISIGSIGIFSGNPSGEIIRLTNKDWSNNYFALKYAGSSPDKIRLTSWDGSTSTNQMVWNENGDAKIPNGVLKVKNHLTSTGSNNGGIWMDSTVTNIDSPGIDGTGHTGLYDKYNDQEVLRAKEGGNVEIPNGNLSLKGGGRVTGLQNPSNAQDAVTKSWAEDNLGHKTYPISLPMTKWGDGLSHEEIHRIEIPSGQKASLYSLDIEIKGGGSAPNLSVDIYDASTTSVIGSDAADGTSTNGNPIGQSSDGATILVRLTNATGSYQYASIQARMVMK